MDKKTTEFMNDIKNNVAPDANEDHFVNEQKCTQLLKQMISKTCIDKKVLVDLITPTDNNGYKYLNGKRNMQRNILIKICVACGQNSEETAKMLKAYGFIHLYPRIKRDYIILQGIENQHSIEQINENLANADELKL